MKCNYKLQFIKLFFRDTLIKAQYTPPFKRQTLIPKEITCLDNLDASVTFIQGMCIKSGDTYSINKGVP